MSRATKPLSLVIFTIFLILLAVFTALPSQASPDQQVTIDVYTADQMIDAIANHNNATIIVHADINFGGAYSGHDALPPIGSGKTITIFGNGHVLTTTRIDFSPGLCHRFFNVGGSLTLNDISLMGGCVEDYGGAIYNAGNLTINNSYLLQNHAKERGGAIFNQGTVTINDSGLFENDAGHVQNEGGFGGAIYNRGMLTINDSDLYDNWTSGYVWNFDLSGDLEAAGGAIVNEASGNVIIDHSTLVRNNTGTDCIMANTCTYKGGTIYNEGKLTIRNLTQIMLSSMATCGATDNGCEKHGSAIYHNGKVSDTSYVSIEHSYIKGSTTAHKGGDLYSDSGWVDISHSTLGENAIVTERGGSIFAWHGTLNITDSTIHQASAGEIGGGIFVRGATLDFDGATIKNNEASVTGGGMYALNCNGTIANSAFNRNKTHLTLGLGGGFYSESNTLTLTGSSFADNLTGFGGAIYAIDSTLDLQTTELLNNDASNFGGGMVTIEGSLTLNDSRIAYNSATSHGGGMWSSATDIAINNNSIINNNSALNGSGISLGSGTLTVTNSQIGYNQAPFGTVALGGGGVFAEDSILLLDNARVHHNSTRRHGGGIHLRNGTLTATNGSQITYNYGQEDGGGLYSDASTITIRDAKINKNDADRGGGILFEVGSSAVITSSTFRDNIANSHGGAILSNDSTVEIARSTLKGNLAQNFGAAIGVSDGSMTVSESYLFDNIGGSGAGFYITDGDVIVTQSALEGNLSRGSGGGFYNERGDLRIGNTTLTGNTARDHGAGIRNEANGTVRAHHVTLWENGTHTISNRGTFILGNSIVDRGSGDDCHGVALDLRGVNISADPSCAAFALNADADLNTLSQPPGDLTPSFVPRLGSPAIDAGGDSVCGYAIVSHIDQHGVARPLDGDADGQAKCDLGAVERDSFPVIGVEVVPGNDSVAEGDSGQHMVALRFVRSGALDGPVTVNYDVVDGTATAADNDFEVPVNRTVTIPADMTTQEFQIPVNGDIFAEADETFTVRIASLSVGTVDPAAREVTVTIVNDDAVDVLVDPTTVTIAEPAGSAVVSLQPTAALHGTLELTLNATNDECVINGHATHGVAFDHTDWQTAKTVTITAVDDALQDGTQPCLVTVAITAIAPADMANYGGVDPDDIAVSVEDNEGGLLFLPTSLTLAEPSDLDGFEVMLSAAPTGTVTIPVEITSDECAFISIGTLYNPAGFTTGTLTWDTQNDAVPVGIQVVDDALIDGDQNCPIIFGAASSNDPAYDGVTFAPYPVVVQDDDAAGIVVDPTSLTVYEPTGTGSFNVRLTSQPTNPVTIPIAADNAQCSLGTVTEVVLDAGNWQAGVDVSVTAVDDGVDDGIQICTIQTAAASSGDGDYTGTDPDDVVVTVIDTNDAGIVVLPTALTVAEPNGSDTFTVSLTRTPTDDVTVPLAATTTECDLGGVTEITLNAAAMNATVTVYAVDDADPDRDQPCPIQVGPSSSADGDFDNLDPDDVAVTVQDDEAVSINVAPTALTIAEPAGSDTFTVSLSSEPRADVTVGLSVSNGECDLGSVTEVTLNAGNWQAGVSVTVTAVDDDLEDGDQTCLVTTAASSSTDNDFDGLDPDDVTVTVQDDDAVDILVAPAALTIIEPNGSDTFTVSLNQQPDDTVQVGISTASSKCAPDVSVVNLDAANWDSGVTVTVAAVDDDMVDGTQPCLVETAPASAPGAANFDGIDPDDVAVNVDDDDTAGIVVAPLSLSLAEPDGSGSFNVRLTSQPANTVTIDLDRQSAECALGSASVVLDTGNWQSGVDVTVSAIDDLDRDGDQSCDITTAPVVSSDANYSGLDADDVAVTVTDDESPHITLDPRILTITEPDGSALFTLTLTDSPVAEVRIGLAASNGECTLNGVTEAVLDDSNWDTGVSVPVSAVDDALADGEQICTIETAAATGDLAYAGQNPRDVTVIVQDDERTVIIVESNDQTTVFEGGATDTYTVQLSGPPSSGETVTVEAQPDVQVTITEIDGNPASAPFALTFNETTWDTPQTMTMQAVDDVLVEAMPHPGVITHTVTSAGGAGLYAATTAPDVTVDVYDNDAAGVLVIPQELTLAEGGAAQSYGLALTTPPAAGETVTVTAEPDAQVTIIEIDGSPISGGPFQVTFDAATWDTPYLFTVEAVDDADPEPTPHSGNIDHHVTSDGAVYGGVSAVPVTAQIADNDGAGVWITPQNLELTVGGAARHYAVVLTQPPAVDEIVTVTLNTPPEVNAAPGDGSPGTVPLTLVYDAVTWDSPQSVAVQPAATDLADGTQVSIMHEVTCVGSAPRYTGATAPGVLVTFRQPPAEPPPAPAGDPGLDVFDPAISKRGVLQPGQLGLPGEQLTWEITVTNTGNVAGSGVVVTDTLVPELRIDQVISERGTYTVNGQTVVFEIGTLMPQESVLLHIVTTVLAGPPDGLIVNRATLDADNLVDTVTGTAVIAVPTSLPSTGYSSDG